MQPTIISRILEAQQGDEKMKQWFNTAFAKVLEEWSVGSNGEFRCGNRLYALDVEDLRKDILNEAHK